MLFNQSALSNTYFTAFSLRANDAKLPAMTKQSQSANAKAKQLHCTHTQTGTELHRVAQKGALTHTQTQAHTEYQTAAHSLTHVHSTNCMLSLRLSLRSARLSLYAASAAALCSLPLTVPAPAFYPVFCLAAVTAVATRRCCCCCCTSDAAFVAVDANNRSTQTGACKGGR